MKLIQMKCENCGAILDVNEDLEKIRCNYCGAELLIDDEATKLKRFEDAKLNSRKANHEQSLKERNDLLEQEVKEKQVKEDLNSVDNFKKSKISKVLLVFFAIAILFFFVGSGFLVKFLTIVQALLFIGAWLMGMGILKEPFRGVRVIATILAFVLIVPIIGTGGGSSDKSEKIVWNDMVLNDVLPKPTGKKGEILLNSDEILNVYIHKQSKEDYSEYVELCKKNGFTIESKNDTDSYDAFNEKGYKLHIRYSDYSEEYEIDLDAPIKTKENVWPNSALASMLPKPNSISGKVESDTEKYFIYYAANTSQEEFNDYIDKLKGVGFNIDYDKSDDYYSASNKEGYSVKVSYEGFNTIKIFIEVPEEKEEVVTENDKKEEQTSKPSNNQMRSDFKKTMDSYEEFMNEYVEFMKKYSKSDGTDLSLLKDYNQMLSKYEKLSKDFENWGDEDLNEKETKYYIEVQTRVNEKLLTIE